MTDFTLDSRLEADTLFIGDLHLSRVLLMNDAQFPWVILVPRRAAMREIIDLQPKDRATLYREIESVSETLQRLFTPTKLNVAALGNMVAQLHVHVIARFDTDAAWPKPVWSMGARVPYTTDAGRARVEALSVALGHL